LSTGDRIVTAGAGGSVAEGGAVVGAVVPVAVAVVATGEGEGVGALVAVGVAAVGVGVVSVLTALQAARVSRAMEASGRARSLSLLTLRGYGRRRAGSRGVAGDQFADVIEELVALFGDVVAEAGSSTAMCLR